MNVLPAFARNARQAEASPSNRSSEEEPQGRVSFHPSRPTENPDFKEPKYDQSPSAGEGDDLQPQAEEEFRTYGNKSPVQLLKITESG